MEKTTKEDVESTLNDILLRLKGDQSVAIFATVAIPEDDGAHKVRFLMLQQGTPAVGAAVAIAVGQHAKDIFGEFDKWLKNAGFIPQPDRKSSR